MTEVLSMTDCLCTEYKTDVFSAFPDLTNSNTGLWTLTGLLAQDCTLVGNESDTCLGISSCEYGVEMNSENSTFFIVPLYETAVRDEDSNPPVALENATAITIGSMYFSRFLISASKFK